MKHDSQGAPAPSVAPRATTLLPLENFQPAFRRTAIASAVVSGAMAIGSLAQAQDSTAQGTPQGGVTTLAPVQVQGQAPYQASEASSVRMTAPLRDTPRTITVVPEQLIQDRGVSTLADVLRTTPGITLGAGEGGTPTGDRPFIRGYESSNDINIDGARDYARGYHETFNLETVEITKGPSSAYGGRGTGGSINLQTKQPKGHDFATVTAGVGNADQWSATLDGNVVVTDRVAMRLNVMKMGGKTPGRDWVTIDRFGIAPSLTIGMGLPTRATLSYSMVKNDDMPDQGFPFSNQDHPEINRPLSGVDRNNFYGRRHVDFRESWSKQGSLLLEHDFANSLHIRNLTRHSETLNHYLMGRPTYDNCNVPTGTQPPNPRLGTPSCNPLDPRAQYTSGTRLRWRGSKALVNQTDLTGEFMTGSVKHTFDLGLEFGYDKIYDRNMQFSRDPNLRINDERDSLYNPDSGKRYNFGLEYSRKLLIADVETRSLYFFDTMDITDQFLVNAGLRVEKYKLTNHAYLGSNNANPTRGIDTPNRTGTFTRSDTMFNYQLGLVYKPAPNGSIYASYATSSNPSGENVGQGGGADGDAASNNITGGGRDQMKPEKSRSIELGTKWDVLEERLSLTASIFETKKTDARSRDPLTGRVTLDGNNRVRGLELGASGSITPRWDIWAGYTYLDPKMTKYQTGGDFQNGVPPTNLSGNRMKFIPKQSASLWTTYKVLPALTLGGGVTYMGMRYADDANTYELPSYRRYDLMAKYDVNKNFSLQLNANNVTDTELYDSSHVGLFYNVGPGRSYMLTATYRYE